MWIRRGEIEALSLDIRRIIDGQDVDLRVSEEGVWNILRNDIHILAKLKQEQVKVLQQDKALLKDTLADISHQLKTPLTSMMIMVDLLEGAPPDVQAEFLQNIKTGLQRTEWLVSTLLKMAKLEAGAVVFAREAVSSSELIEQALAPLQIQLELKGQRVELQGEAELYCDRRWTAEALGNILKNASEHSPEGAVILVEVGANPISTWISVTDSGPGLSTAQIAKLFRRFEGSQSGAGYGIGLPLALAILRGQDGDIEVNGGGHGVGATVVVKLFR
ncbi:MAG: HAMP domain-containing histidine kinase [Oscillospiraceae bacterium]|nr:HAMP domain-containing histidine kinase [Oscillospiraceae bacterium]